MNQRTVLSALPIVFLAVPAFAQAPAAPAAPAPAAAPAAATPAPAAAVPAAATPAAGPPAPAAAAATPPAAPAPEPVAAPAAEAAKNESKEEKPDAPDRIAVAKTGYFQPGGLFQVWAVASHLDAPGPEVWTSGFRIRRAEIKAKGDIIPKTFGWAFMVDPARLLDFQNRTIEVEDQEPAPTTPGTVTVAQPPSGGATSLLQDVSLTYFSEYADVSLGQFKIPVSYEGYNSSSKTVFPERALVSRRFGDRRDIGLKIEKKFDMFGYVFGLFNGEGQNRADSNDQKDVALRLEVYPIKGITAAVVGYTGVTERDLPGTKDRVEGDIKVELSDFLLQAEYIHGWDVNSSGTRVPGQGFYALAGYTFFEKLQPVFRIGSLDPDSDNDEHGAIEPDRDDETTTYELELNYYFKQHDCKMQLAGGFFDPEQRSQNTRFDLTLAAQIAF